VLGRHWFWTPLRVVLLLATITLRLGWLAKAPWPQTYRGSVAFGGRWPVAGGRWPVAGGWGVDSTLMTREAS
jgi:hypothetical protein